MKKIWKTIFYLSVVIGIPAFVIIAVLYSNDKQLLHQFQKWISIPGNLSAFVVSIGLYFPLTNGIIKFVINLTTIFKNRNKNKLAKNSTKIFQNDKILIAFNENTNELISKIRVDEKMSLDKLANVATAEIKGRIQSFQKNKKDI